MTCITNMAAREPVRPWGVATIKIIARMSKTRKDLAAILAILLTLLIPLAVSIGYEPW